MTAPIILDCDDVLLDWCGGFRNWLATEKKVVTTTKEPTDWDLSHWTGLTPEQNRAYIEEFNGSEKFQVLKAVDGARSAIDLLLAVKHPPPLYVLTSCSDDPKIIENRKMNLNIRFGNVFHGVICLPLGVPKTEYLDAFKTLYGPCIWIEDNYKHALAGDRLGHRTFLLRRPHNRAHETHYNFDRHSIKWVSSWQEILSHLN